MTEREPEYVWAFPPEKRRGGRGWLIGVLVAAAVAIAVGVLLLFVRPWASAEPAATPTPTPSVSASATPSASPTTSPSVTPTPSPTQSQPPAPQPTATPPTPADPALPVFRTKVQPLLDDAETGLSYASDADSQEGMQIAEQLRGDAGRMADAVAPSSIAGEWANAVSAYGSSLDNLRKAFETGSATAGALSSARSALSELQDLVDG